MWDSGRFISNLQFELFLYKYKSLLRKLAAVLALKGGRFSTERVTKAHQPVLSNAELACLVYHFVCKSFSVYYFHDG